MKKFSCAPDDKHDWQEVGFATKSHWKDGRVPDNVIMETPDGAFLYRSYAGSVWRCPVDAVEQKKAENEK